MYNQLAGYLKNTRGTLKAACVAMNIIPETVDLDVLPVTACDNCGVWLNPKHMAHDADGTVMCHFCHDMDTLRF